MIDARTIEWKPAFFPMPRLRNSCAECGTRILDANGQTVEEQDLGYRRVHFDLSDGTAAFVSFCPLCASKPWPPERIAALERQCRFGWKHIQTPANGVNWSGDSLSFKPALRDVQTWADVQ